MKLDQNQVLYVIVQEKSPYRFHGKILVAVVSKFSSSNSQVVMTKDSV